MVNPRRVIFREKALKYYSEGKEENVLPHFVSPPVMLLLWCLLGLTLVSSAIAWSWRVPTYIAGAGEISVQGSGAQQHALIVVLLPADQLSRLHHGLLVQLHIGQSGPKWQQTITEVEPGVMSPAEVRNRFGLDGVANLLAVQPSSVVLIRTSAYPSLQLYAGSLVQATIQIGSQRIISLLPGLSGLGGE